MSKIQINELNNNSELEVLNAQETTEVVGGFYSSSYYSSKYAEVFQNNANVTNQAALTFYGDARNSNTTDQSNSANVYQ